MRTKDLANIFNRAPIGNNTRKEAMKILARKEMILFIDSLGLIWPKKLSRDKNLSYTVSLNQLLIRNDSNEIVKKISFANILRMDPSELAAENPVMKLSIKND